MFGFYSMFSEICSVITSIRCAFKTEHAEVNGAQEKKSIKSYRKSKK